MANWDWAQFILNIIGCNICFWIGFYRGRKWEREAENED